MFLLLDKSLGFATHLLGILLSEVEAFFWVGDVGSFRTVFWDYRNFDHLKIGNFYIKIFNIPEILAHPIPGYSIPHQVSKSISYNNKKQNF
jgi:hypothetical protein